jgi:hypothetical protein
VSGTADELKGMSLLAFVVAALLVAAPQASQAAFGDNFGIADVNTPGAPSAPAFPGTEAFWAGTCDVASAPTGPIGGGVGNRPTHVWAPSFLNGAWTDEGQQKDAPSEPDSCVDFGRIRARSLNFWAQPPEWRLAPVTQAGAHPDGTATMWFRRGGSGIYPEGSVDNIYVDLPAGFVGDPTAVPKCTAEQFAYNPVRCPPQTQVGVINLYLTAVPAGIGGNYGSNTNQEILPVFNLEPRHGNVAELGFGDASDANATSVRIVAKPRTGGDFGVTAFAAQIPAALPLLAQSLTLWGVPWADSHDEWRPQGELLRGLYPALGVDVRPGSGNRGENRQGGIPVGGLAPEHRVGYARSWGRIKPFLSNPTECSGSELSTTLSTDSYEHPGALFDGLPDPADGDWRRYQSPASPVTGCEKVPFDVAAAFEPSSTAPDSASGLGVDITIPQNDEFPFDPPPPGASPAVVDEYVDRAAAHWRSDAGLATSHLDKTVVTLPEGMSVNTSGAAGLQGCSDAQIGLRQLGNPPLFNDSEPACPNGSKIGIVEATTPLLEGSPNLAGEVFVGEPKAEDIDCPGVGGQVSRRPNCPLRVRMFLVLRNPERGLLAKVYGSAVADPTGRLTATFDKNPRVPVENIKLAIEGGGRGLLAMPQTCGTRSIDSVFSPWSAAHGGGGPVRALSDPFTVSGDCSFGFAPSIRAGMSTKRARAHGSFSFEFTRPEGQQWVRGLTAELPTGLLARVRGVPLCGDAQATAGACPRASKIGIVDAAAGSGNPLVLEEKGEVFLTRGYKGAPYGLMVKIRGIAGPFRGAHELAPIVVRQALHVDPTTAQPRVVSDPFPLIHHGVPLRVRQVIVVVNRPRFALNPSNCDRKLVVGDFTSAQGTQARATALFQADRCQALPFRPKLRLRLTGRKQTRTGKHPGVRAMVTQRRGQAGIRRAEVRLPKALALDTDNAQALCEFEAGTKPDLERHCPKGSIVGRARAVSPLLNRPLRGNVYFVKNVRRGASGNLIRTLPMLIVALRGEIAVNLKGTSNVKRGKLVNTFANVPDAPVSRFNLNVKGGKNGILTITRTARKTIDICKGRQIAVTRMSGQNGRRHNTNTKFKTPCKQQRKGAKRGSKKRS